MSFDPPSPWTRSPNNPKSVDVQKSFVEDTYRNQRVKISRRHAAAGPFLSVIAAMVKVEVRLLSGCRKQCLTEVTMLRRRSRSLTNIEGQSPSLSSCFCDGRASGLVGAGLGGAMGKVRKGVQGLRTDEALTAS